MKPTHLSMVRDDKEKLDYIKYTGVPKPHFAIHLSS